LVFFIFQEPNQDGTVSLINKTLLDEFEPGIKRPGGCVPWAPPQQNWNPWSNCNIDEGPLAFVSDSFWVFFWSLFKFLQDDVACSIMILLCQIPRRMISPCLWDDVALWLKFHFIVDSQRGKKWKFSSRFQQDIIGIMHRGNDLLYFFLCSPL
jgi:hypothetical protein